MTSISTLASTISFPRRRPGRVVLGEEFGVNAVERPEVARVVQPHSRLDDVLQRASGERKRLFDVFQRHISLPKADRDSRWRIDDRLLQGAAADILVSEVLPTRLHDYVWERKSKARQPS